MLRITALLLLTAVVFVNGCQSSGLVSTEERIESSRTPVPLPMTATPNSKHLRMVISVTERDVIVDQIFMDYGITRSYGSDPDQFRIKLIGFSENILGEIRTWDPRATAAYEIDADGTFTDPFTFRSEATGDLIVPFVADLASLELTDRGNSSYARVDLVDAIQAFCAANPSDTECIAWLRNVKSDSASDRRSK